MTMESMPIDSQIRSTEALPLPLNEVDIFVHPELLEPQFPNFRRTVHFVRQFESAKPKGRKNILDQLSTPVVKDPQLLVDMLGNLDLVGTLRGDTKTDELKEEMVKSVEDITRRRPTFWKPEAIQKLVKAGLDKEGNVKDSVKRVQKALFNSARTVEDSIDVQYNAAWAMATAVYPDVTEEINSILCFQRDVFTPESFAAYVYLCGNGLTDDIHIRRYFVVNRAVNQPEVLKELARGRDSSMSERFTFKHRAVSFAFHTLPYEEKLRRTLFVRGLELKYRKRYERYLQAKEDEPPIKPSSSHLFTLEEANFEEQARMADERREKLKGLPWPDNLVYGFEDPLDYFMDDKYGKRTQHAVWENQKRNAMEVGLVKLTEKPIKLDDDLELEILGKGYESAEQKAEVIRTIYDAILQPEIMQNEEDTVSQIAGAIKAARSLDGLMGSIKKLQVMFSIAHQLSENEVGRLSSVIQYHRPVMSIEQARTINEHLIHLRHDIKERFTRGVGSRGFLTLIADPVLAGIGYHSILFAQEKSSNVLTVTINILGHDYQLALDQDFRTSFTHDVKSFDTIQDQSWLELLILSHLEKVLCTREEDMVNELLGHEKQESFYKKQTFGRIEHLRRLPPGQQYSKDAFLRCLTSSLLLKDLAHINRLRAGINFGGTIETGIWTHVSPVEKVDSLDAAPIKIAFKDAVDAMRKIVPLGQVSDEELARVEREILAELEIT